jgi:hypothetical protein
LREGQQPAKHLNIKTFSILTNIKTLNLQTLNYRQPATSNQQRATSNEQPVKPQTFPPFPVSEIF